MPTSLADRLRLVLRDVPDFPTPGILFKDITPVLARPSLMREVVEAMIDPFRASGITHVVGVESRGFLFGVPMALALQVPFAPARKPGKLPWTTERESYHLEYGSATLEMHADALEQGASERSVGAVPPRVLVVDDVLATGGTAAATCNLIARLGGQVAGISMLVELTGLDGRRRLPACPIATVLAL